MAIVVTVKDSQAIYRTEDFKFQGTYLVDDALTLGLKKGFFFGIQGAGTGNGVAQCTLTYANATAVTYGAGVLATGAITVPITKASGIIYESSAIDQYRRTDAVTDEPNVFPAGNREYVGFGLMKKGVLEISDDTNGQATYFTSVKTAIGTTSAQTGTTTFTMTLPGDLRTSVKIGDKLSNNGVIVWVTDVTYSSPSTVITTALGGYGDTASKVVYKMSQIDDPVYLADTMAGDLPFTTLVPTTGKLKQIVGYIESPIAVRIDLELNPAIV